MTDCYIYDHVRTPRGRGKQDGSLHEVTALGLATRVLTAIRDRNHLDTRLLDDVVLGCVDPVGEQGSDIARIAVMNADYAESVPGAQLNRFCSSGLDAINMVAAQIMADQAELAIGGGVEAMSRIGMLASGGSWWADPTIAIKSYFVPQGISADLLATRYGYSRQAVDIYAVESQRRAWQACENGHFLRSIVPVRDQNGLLILDRDEHVRPDATLETLATLRPAFADIGERYGFDAVAIQRYPELEAIHHVHHAGNSSGIVDGAAAVLLGSKEAGQRAGLKPRAKLRAFASIGTEPCLMLTGPAPASRKALLRAGMSVSDIDLFEVNEAFAAVVLRYMDELDISQSQVNVNGGAIALGHPLGATGAMLLGILLDELERRNLAVGLVTLCVGAGMGTATVIERV